MWREFRIEAGADEDSKSADLYIVVDVFMFP